MASSTYLSLTNKLLRRLNEVEIAQTDFLITRGVQSLAKDAVQSAIRKINQTNFEWSFNSVQTTQVLTPGTQEYTWPANMRTPDWESFQIMADDALSVSYSVLDWLDRDIWYQTTRSMDKDAGSDGRGVPTHVFEGHAGGFGVTPSPDAAYTIVYRYTKNETTLVNHGDTSSIPDLYDEVIIQCALFYMYMYRDNSEQAQIAEQSYKKYIADMQNVFNQKSDRIHSTMVAWII